MTWTRIEMKEEYLYTSTGKNLGAPGTQLFTALLNIFENDEKFPNFTFKFAVHLTGIVDNFCLYQMDHLLSKRQLWSSVITDQEKETSDFKLIASDGNVLPVHKWILAARSPVFEDLFSDEEDVKSIHLAGDCNVDEMKQFVKFICTGELEGLVTENLMRLAVKYRIKTLKDLCKAAFHDAYDFSTDKMARIAFQMESDGSQLPFNTRHEPDVDLSDVDLIYASTLKCSWKVSSVKENEETIKMNIPFEHEGRKLFRAGLTLKKRPNRRNEQWVELKFLSHGHGRIGCKIDEVTCFIGQEENGSIQHQMKMIKAETNHKELLQVFTATKLTTPLSCPFVITFFVELSNNVPDFANKLLDSTWTEEIWAAAVNRKMTDVELLVGEEVFGAHRSLFSARSPVFAAMFASGMKEAETGRVHIEDVAPDTFQRFLKFLYTGLMKPSSVDRELIKVAEKYRVETLCTELCLPATKPIDNLDDVFNAFLLC